MGKILPNKIKPGDTIGVFSPSSPTTKEALEKMKVYFESKGYKFKVADNALESFGFMAGTPEKRANDLLHEIDSMLAHFKLAGIFGLINGLIVGELVECKENSYPQIETMEDILLRNCKEFDFPIVTNVPLGHTDDKITLPIGSEVTLNSRAGTLELLEHVVK